jgi:hypothetical protein
VDSTFLAPFAVFFQLNFARNKLLVLACHVIDIFAFAANQFYQSILRHIRVKLDT